MRILFRHQSDESSPSLIHSYVVTLPAFQRCQEGGPDAAERRPGSGFPTGRGTEDGHLEAHHDLQARPARPGKATRLGVRGSIVPAASRT
ncbi:hypothetical protein MKX01_002511 [Papaver californicum]|nr:hypothetical protein MKX01_002511 [Papaver californicum]